MVFVPAFCFENYVKKDWIFKGCSEFASNQVIIFPDLFKIHANVGGADTNHGECRITELDLLRLSEKYSSLL